ncbi:hypothetical protein L7F22_023809 [Adiantum nelumboides]|nr:hypothetical protein [Adiantum nelumboides]
MRCTEKFLRTMRAIQGALIASSIIQIVLGFSGRWGIVVRYISPLGATPLVGLVGLGLYSLGFPGVAKCIEIGLSQLIALLILSQVSIRLPSEIVLLRIPYPLKWGHPTFDAAHTFSMMASILVATVESTGGYLSVMRFASATPLPPFIMSRGIGWQGVSVLIDGLLETLTGSTVSIENVGLLGSTKVGSRRVTEIVAGFMIFFSLFGD